MTELEKYKIKEEKKLVILLNRLFKKQEKKLGELISSYDTKSLQSDIEEEVETYTVALLAILIKYVEKVMTFGFKTGKSKFKAKLPKDFNIDFEDAGNLAYRYIKSLKTLHLSNRNGSISKTTNKRIRKLLAKGLKQGLSYGEIGKQINKLDPFVFGKSRSELIAVNEIGKAYSFGNYIPAKKLQDDGVEMVKYAITAGDEKVRPEHVQNGQDGRIPLNKNFSGTNTKLATTGYRCRCDTGYDEKDK